MYPLIKDPKCLEYTFNAHFHSQTTSAMFSAISLCFDHKPLISILIGIPDIKSCPRTQSCKSVMAKVSELQSSIQPQLLMQKLLTVSLKYTLSQMYNIYFNTYPLIKDPKCSEYTFNAHFRSKTTSAMLSASSLYSQTFLQYIGRHIGY